MLNHSLKLRAAISTAFVAIFTLAPLAGAADAAQPNIVYILTDDLGYGDLSCYGQKKFKTPNIDRMATEGMKFTQHYSGSTVCAPARCSLMTGLHTGHAQVRGNRELRPAEGQAPMRADTVTIPRVLAKAGYVNGIFGKWGLGGPGSPSDPMEHFNEFYGYNCQREAHNFYPTHLWHNREKVSLDGETYSHDLIMQAALNFIRDNKSKPFFCYLSVTIPHAAMHAPETLHDKYRKQYPQFDDKVGKYSGPNVINPVAAFPAMMEHLDNGVGQVISLLKELGLEENTLVIFTSDNGPHKEGGHQPEFWDSNGPLTGLKRSVTEGGIRVPLLARWPGTIKAGSISEHASAFWDMMPTFCELAGTKSPKTDGLSMLSALTGKGKQAEHPYLYWEFHEQGGKQALRKGDWKLLRRSVKGAKAGPYLLYNLKEDLSESNDLSAKHPERVKELSALMADAHDNNTEWPFGHGED